MGRHRNRLSDKGKPPTPKHHESRKRKHKSSKRDDDKKTKSRESTPNKQGFYTKERDRNVHDHVSTPQTQTHSVEESGKSTRDKGSTPQTHKTTESSKKKRNKKIDGQAPIQTPSSEKENDINIHDEAPTPNEQKPLIKESGKKKHRKSPTKETPTEKGISTDTPDQASTCKTHKGRRSSKKDKNGKKIRHQTPTHESFVEDHASTLKTGCILTNEPGTNIREEALAPTNQSPLVKTWESPQDQDSMPKSKRSSKKKKRTKTMDDQLPTQMPSVKKESSINTREEAPTSKRQKFLVKNESDKNARGKIPTSKRQEGSKISPTRFEVQIPLFPDRDEYVELIPDSDGRYSIAPVASKNRDTKAKFLPGMRLVKKEVMSPETKKVLAALPRAPVPVKQDIEPYGLEKPETVQESTTKVIKKAKRKREEAAPEEHEIEVSSEPDEIRNVQSRRHQDTKGRLGSTTESKELANVQLHRSNPRARAMSIPPPKTATRHQGEKRRSVVRASEPIQSVKTTPNVKEIKKPGNKPSPPYEMEIFDVDAFVPNRARSKSMPPSSIKEKVGISSAKTMANNKTHTLTSKADPGTIKTHRHERQLKPEKASSAKTTKSKPVQPGKASYVDLTLESSSDEESIKNEITLNRKPAATRDQVNNGREPSPSASSSVASVQSSPTPLPKRGVKRPHVDTPSNLNTEERPHKRHKPSQGKNMRPRTKVARVLEEEFRASSQKQRGRESKSPSSMKKLMQEKRHK